MRENERVIAHKFNDEDDKQTGEYCTAEMEFRDGGFSMHGSCGMFMPQTQYEEMVEDYWDNIDVEGEYDYLWEESRGRRDDPYEPDREDYKTDKEYEEAYENYEQECDDYEEDKKRFFDSLENDLRDSGHPYETHAWEGDFVFTSESGGQIDMHLCTPQNDLISPTGSPYDLDAICRVWDKWHLKPISEADKERALRLFNKFPTIEEFVSKNIGGEEDDE